MTFFYYISDFIIPILLFYIVAFALTEKVHVYDEFVTGAADGIRTVLKILPTLVGLMAAVGMLRASGFLDLRSHVSGAGYLQILRDGLLHRSDRIHYDGLYGDRLLYHERLFSDCEGDQDQVDAGRGADQHLCGNRRKCGAGGSHVGAYIRLLSKYGNCSKAFRMS